jgi:trimethylamine--corrinoid protein Co-methyltransferase
MGGSGVLEPVSRWIQMIESPCAVFEILSKDDLYRIHTSTLEVLERVGVRVEEETALKLLDDVGADVDYKENIAKIPQHLMDEATRASPRTILFAGRNRRYDMRLEGKRIHFGTGEGSVGVLDHDTGSVRPSTKMDVANVARLADALPNLDFVMPVFTAQDVPTRALPLHDLHATLKNTEKPVMVVDFGLDVSYLIKMASVVVGGEAELEDRPILGLYSEPASPLTHGRNHTRNLMTFAKWKLPIVYIPGPASGSTAPATIAGALVQANAETLSGNIIAQFTSKGAKFIYGAGATVFDQRTGVFPYGAPEFLLTNLATAQLGRYYGFPTWSTGGCSDSKILDGQATLEAALSLFVAAQSGANLIHDVGSFLNLGLIGSPELLTICDEIVSMISYFLNGIKVTDETLAVDVIRKVGPGGHYLSQSHTLRFFEKEHWFPSLLDRQTREAWRRGGRKDLLHRAREKTERILETHSPTPLLPDIERELDHLVEQTEKAIQA